MFCAYTVIVENSCKFLVQRLQQSFWILTEPSGVVVYPEDTVVIAGSTVILTCVAFGEPLPSITWSVDGANVTNDSRIEIIELRTSRNGRPFLKSVLQICGVGDDDAGRYNCTAVNTVNTDSADFSLTVITEPATLVMVPENIVTLAGVSVTLTCVAFGYPIPRIRWEKTDHISRTTVQHTNTTQIMNRVINRNTTQLQQSTLFLCSSEVISTAVYSCIADNGLHGGETTRVDVTVDVRGEIVRELLVDSSSANLSLFPSVLPTIMESGGSNTSLEVGQSVYFVCTADGAPIPSITWFKDGCRVQATMNRRFNVSETLVSGFQPHLPQARRSVLALSDLREEDAGNYSCGVSNEVDTAILTEPYTLIVSRGKTPLAQSVAASLTSSDTVSLQTCQTTVLAFPAEMEAPAQVISIPTAAAAHLESTESTVKTVRLP